MKQRPLSATGFLLAILLLYTWQADAQPPTLGNLMDKAKKATGKEQVNVYLELADLGRNINVDTSIYFSKQAMKAAEENGYTMGQIQALQAMGRAYSSSGSYHLSQKYFSQALDMARKEKIDSLVNRSLFGIANCFWHLGNHAEALEYNFKGLQSGEKIRNIHNIASAKIGIGMIYQSQEKPQLAEQYISAALLDLNGSNYTGLQLNALHTLANVHGMQGKIKEAFALDQQGIALADKTNNQLAKSLFFDNMANCYLYGSPPDYPKAIEYFKKTLAIDSAYDNKKQMSDSYKNLGTVYFARQDYVASIPYFQRGIELAQQAGFVQGEQQGYEALAKAYRLLNRNTEAYDVLRKSMRVKDSLINISSENRIAELQTFYETEKQKQTIELQESRLSKQQYVLIGTVITALLLALLGFSAYRRYRLKEKANLQAAIMKQQELSTKAVMEAEEEERQRIARDLHDGVGQMMSAAKMNLSAFESELHFNTPEQQLSFERIIGLVDDSCKEIRSVSHNMMPNALLKNSLAAAVRDFIDKIDKKTLQVHLYTEGLDERIDANIETVFYRVIQECVNNVIKHAGANVLDISVIRDADGISATIEDNGKGFNTADTTRFEGIGLKNILTRVDYLKGTVDFDSTPGKGTLVAIHVPLTNQKQ